MANTPNPEFISEVMERDFGTAVLITNAKSDRYLKKVHSSHEIKENLHPVENTDEIDIYSKWCGGQGGFDVLVERLEDN
ncbi:hypothetical cyanophage protein [Synechococcus phage S-CRM01]|uniref:hypothetical cyanophage protein n=1 Tax=Synechococcus phage S-CRM01 TaxID=1026955 RepID=UPI000209E324|nr:hypothetical cyanophage protein [Synechococcus phage S-CRM01]AEC53242.1 hypothetical cyanophage protein [Synechococcus phage S-CRM01]